MRETGMVHRTATAVVLKALPVTTLHSSSQYINTAAINTALNVLRLLHDSIACRKHSIEYCKLASKHATGKNGFIYNRFNPAQQRQQLRNCSSDRQSMCQSLHLHLQLHIKPSAAAIHMKQAKVAIGSFRQRPAATAQAATEHTQGKTAAGHTRK